MRRQRNTFQMKEQDNISEKDKNEMQINNLLDKKVKVMIKDVLTKLRRRKDEHSENFNKEMENRKKNLSELNSMITKI